MTNRYKMGVVVFITCFLNLDAIASDDNTECKIHVDYCGELESPDEYNRIVVRSYNEDDVARTIAYDDATISAGNAATVKCDTDNNCYIAAELYGAIGQSSNTRLFACDAHVYIYSKFPQSASNATYTFNTNSCN